MQRNLRTMLRFLGMGGLAVGVVAAGHAFGGRKPAHRSVELVSADGPDRRCSHLIGHDRLPLAPRHPDTTILHCGLVRLTRPG